MKCTKLILSGLVFLAIAPGAFADEREMLAQVAREAGVSVDDVRMVLGSRTQHSQYRASFDRKEARVKAVMARLAAEEKAQRAAREVAQVDPKK